MLKNTFCHLSGMSAEKEQKLWSEGICSWNDLRSVTGICGGKTELLASQIDKSFQSLQKNDVGFFARALPTAQHWRLFPEFRQSIAYLDIETTGLGQGDHITTIALYDGSDVFYYVYGDNLNDFKKDIKKYQIIVSYNGKTFDVPFIERSLKIRMNHAHIDLRYVLKALGYTGGLKGCEKQLGIGRDELEGVDGYAAVLLWQEYRRSGDLKALETLLAYNILDVINLESLLVIAYNKSLPALPFSKDLKIDMPASPANPFEPDMRMLGKVMRGRMVS